MPNKPFPTKTKMQKYRLRLHQTSSEYCLCGCMNTIEQALWIIKHRRKPLALKP